MKLIFSGIVLCFAFAAQGQSTFKAVIKSGEQVLGGATVTWKNETKSYVADSSGMVMINNVPGGRQLFLISHIGYKEMEISVTLALPADTTIEINMEKQAGDENEVIITSTRTSRTISNIPTRTEVISGAELEEKGNMKPGDIRMMLNESTGIQTQQTSATSFNSSIRIQGLDGRYTQILKDGFPLYAGFSGGLSLMQIVPLDLKQVEVIKGSSSTLYGGGAIAGLVNLISKTPGDRRELNFLTNVTSAKGVDVSGFYSEKFKKTGVTVFGSRNSGAPYDPAGIGLTAIPKFERYIINPRIFFYGNRTSANVGFSYVTENRIGGSVEYIKQGTAGYFEKNSTDRFSTEAAIVHKISGNSSITFKNSYNHFKRSIIIPSAVFSGVQQSSFSELTYNYQTGRAQWVTGTNFLTDDFKEDKRNDLPRDYHYNTYGLFVQNTWNATKLLTIETGIRGDYIKQYGFTLLPRISGLLKITSKLTARMGGGMGYKTPTVFNEESEKIQFQHIFPINQQTSKNEKSTGTNFDINYRASAGQLGISINQLFFYTQLNKPLILVKTLPGNLEFVNAHGHIDTRGTETNIKLTYDDFKLFIGYTYADVNTHFNQVKSWLPLTARHRLNNVLIYEKEGKLKLGLEAYFFSPQKLSDNSIGRSYWIGGFMAERSWKHVSIFINFENFTDTRQTKFDIIYTGPINNPTFKDIYAPLDGFLVNGGIKIRL